MAARKKKHKTDDAPTPLRVALEQFRADSKRILAGGGTSFNAPSWRDNDDDSNILVDRVSTDDPGVVATPANIQSNQEIARRLSRNQSWKTMDLAAALAGDDPANSIASNVAAYWRRRLQAVFVSTWTGIFADNAQVAPNDDPRAGITNTAAQDELTVDISGAFTPGVTRWFFPRPRKTT